MELISRPFPWASWLQVPIPSTVELQVGEWEILPAWGCVRTSQSEKERVKKMGGTYGWGAGDKHLAYRRR